MMRVPCPSPCSCPTGCDPGGVRTADKEAQDSSAAAQRPGHYHHCQQKGNTSTQQMPRSELDVVRGRGMTRFPSLVGK